MNRFLSAVVGSSLLLAACGGDDTTDDAASPSSVSASDGSDAGDTASSGAVLDFVGTDVRGNAVDVSVYEGSELVVWFWAPW